MDGRHLDGVAGAGAKVATVMTQGGAATAVVGGLTLSELGVVVGIAVSVLGLIGGWIIRWYWEAKRHELERERLEWDRRRASQPVPFDRRGAGE